MKKCTRCQQTKEINSFAIDKSGRDGHRSICKVCHAAWMKNYNLEHAEENRLKQKIRDSKRPKGSRHNIDQATYDSMLGRFKGKCWACRENDATHIDHDHGCCSGTYSCGKCVRGLLCRSCNLAYGMLGESKERVQNLLNYASAYR